MTENAAGFYVTAADLRWCVRNYLPGDADPADPAISPMNAPELNGLPATVLAVAEFDPLRDQGTRYGTRLRDAGMRAPWPADREPRRRYHGPFG